jgi:hypothetical protein
MAARTFSSVRESRPSSALTLSLALGASRERADRPVRVPGRCGGPLQSRETEAETRRTGAGAGAESYQNGQLQEAIEQAINE